MRAGDLRHRVTIQSANETTLAGNQKLRDWDNPITVATVRAKVTELVGDELVAAQQIYSEMRYTVSMRNCSLTSVVTTHHRLLYKGRQLRILGPPTVVGKLEEELVLSCMEV
jgi:SPP1 family predicted phage head-tail adaptor